MEKYLFSFLFLAVLMPSAFLPLAALARSEATLARSEAEPIASTLSLMPSRETLCERLRLAVPLLDPLHCARLVYLLLSGSSHSLFQLLGRSYLLRMLSAAAACFGFGAGGTVTIISSFTIGTLGWRQGVHGLMGAALEVGQRRGVGGRVGAYAWGRYLPLALRPIHPEH